jgi:translocation and assembly module TamA
MANPRFSRFTSFVFFGASLTAPLIHAVDVTPNTATPDTSASTSGQAGAASPPSTASRAIKVAANPVQVTPAAAASTAKAIVAATPESAATPTVAPPVPAPKLTFWNRVHNVIFFWRKPLVPEADGVVPAEPTISVKVYGAPDALTTNLQETLQQIRVAELSDFQNDLARYRSMAQDAAQAVGYYNASFKFRKLSDTSIAIDVVPGDPVRVTTQKITITGDAKTDRSFIRLQNKPDISVGDILNHGEYEKTKNKITNLALDHGYFKGHYLAHDVKVTLPTKTADINLAYDSGVRYQFGDITYKNSNGSDKLPLKPSVLALLQPIKPGQPYDAGQLAKLSKNLLDTRYFNNVQVDAPTPDPDDDDKALSPVVNDTPVAADGSGTPPSSVPAPTGSTKDDVTPAQDPNGAPVAAIATMTATAPVAELSPALDATTKSAQGLLTATSPDELPEPNKAAPKIPVVITLNADQPNSAEVGLGFGTDTGPRIRTQYRRALVNDRGDSFDANAEISKIQHTFDLRYNRPLKSPLEDVVSLFGGFEDQKLSQSNNLNVDTQTLTVGVEHTVKPKGDWQRTYSVRYRLDRLQNNPLAVDPATLPLPFNVEGIAVKQQSLLAGFGLNKISSRGGANPTSGFRQFYQIEVGNKTALSDANMIILQAGFRALDTFAEKHQIVLSADIGTIITNEFSKVPYSLRFFAGGDQSIRGFDYKSLSTQINGYEIGGRNLAVGSVEYNYLFQPKWRGAVFLDAGNAFDAKFTDPVKMGAGFGIRWASPVGPVRVDIAAGISERSPPIRLVFYIGAPL